MAADPRRVKELFVALLDLPDPQARQAFLERECAADAELRQRLESLLQGHFRVQSHRCGGADEPLSLADVELSPLAIAIGAYDGAVVFADELSAVAANMAAREAVALAT